MGASSGVIELETAYPGAASLVQSGGRFFERASAPQSPQAATADNAADDVMDDAADNTADIADNTADTADSSFNPWWVLGPLLGVVGVTVIVLAVRYGRRKSSLREGSRR